MPAGVFSVLPENFFSVLTSINRRHYAALLVLYYRLFQENIRGLEREHVIREFMNYLAVHRDTLADEIDVSEDEPEEEAADERVLANRFLRRFINTGWLGEETLANFTKAAPDSCGKLLT